MFSFLMFRNWRLIGLGIGIIALLASIWAGYAYLTGLQNRIEVVQISLANERYAREIAEATVVKMQIDAEQAQEDLFHLEEANKAAEESWIATLKLIDDLEDCPAPPAPVSDTPPANPSQPTVKSENDTVDRLNRANSDLNRMLERIGQ